MINWMTASEVRSHILLDSTEEFDFTLTEFIHLDSIGLFAPVLVLIVCTLPNISTPSSTSPSPLKPLLGTYATASYWYFLDRNHRINKRYIRCLVGISSLTGMPTLPLSIRRAIPMPFLCNTYPSLFTTTFWSFRAACSSHGSENLSTLHLTSTHNVLSCDPIHRSWLSFPAKPLEMTLWHLAASQWQPLSTSCTI